MGDPGSLMAMIESHLSKTSLTTSQDADDQAGPSSSLSNDTSVQNSSSKTALPPPTVMQLPRFEEVNDSEINELLTQQVQNIIMARQNALNEEKEKQRLALELSRMNLRDESTGDFVIDLSASIMRPGQQSEQQVKCLTQSNSSSVESLHTGVGQNIGKNLLEPKKDQLPTHDNMSYMLCQRVKRGRCSSFGKVLSTRLRPTAAPYMRTKITNPDVVPFDFSAPSPCDTNKAKKLPMTMSPEAYIQKAIMERVMEMTKDEESS